MFRNTIAIVTMHHPMEYINADMTGAETLSLPLSHRPLKWINDRYYTWYGSARVLI